MDAFGFDGVPGVWVEVAGKGCKAGKMEMGAAMLAWKFCLYLRPTAVLSGRGAFFHTMPHR